VTATGGLDRWDRYRARFGADTALDAFHSATAIYWRRRAAQLRWAQPRAGEFFGQATTDEQRERWRRLEEQAKACEHRARVALLGGDLA